MYYHVNVKNPCLIDMGYIKAVANLQDKHDRSAPSDYHWKILKCRMLIFSNPAVLACPDKQEVKKIHVIFNKFGDNYDKLMSLLLKFSLEQDGTIAPVIPEIYKMSFQYTLTARLAPIWNVLGMDYLVNNRDFLIAKEPQEGIKYHIITNEHVTTLKVKPVKINLIRSNDDFLPGEYVRVLPSLNKAIVEESCDLSHKYSIFKSYKDLRRHWKNIHGYRLPDNDAASYCLIRFWRGEPLTYPKICVTRNFPIVIPVMKSEERNILNRFINSLKNKMSNILGTPLIIQQNYDSNYQPNEMLFETQAISLCTPSQTYINDITHGADSQQHSKVRN